MAPSSFDSSFVPHFSDTSRTIAHDWTRRAWITRTAAAVASAHLLHGTGWSAAALKTHASSEQANAGTSDWPSLARRAIEAAMHAGAQYADVRFTRTVSHGYRFVEIGACRERVGVGVRALVKGYWGFTAMPSGSGPDVERLARAAVAQAQINAQGVPRTVRLGTLPSATGHWTMPGIDPFTVPIEEKLATLAYWVDYGGQIGINIDTSRSSLYNIRHERLTATSEGSMFTQTVYESGGEFIIVDPDDPQDTDPARLPGFTPAGKGWELFADVPAKLRAMPDVLALRKARKARPKVGSVGRYTLVCDGMTMAALLDRTLGIATQLDRALGYEANASGTSFLSDPLAMLGTFPIGSPLVTVMGNRSAPGQLATVRWDEEGVTPEQFTLVKDGVLTDFQTTREQAAWLEPYYQQRGMPVRSNGCAGIEDAITPVMQHPPNLGLAPSTADMRFDALLQQANEGILIVSGKVTADMQARTGTLSGEMYEIRGGRIGRRMNGGAGVLFNTLELWKHVTALGDASTQDVLGTATYPYPASILPVAWYPIKGEPPQFASYSVQAPAGLITNQALIDLSRKA